ncbi:hypothetical protein ABPG74_001978, partial [Tetrahymena malaccensis]
IVMGVFQAVKSANPDLNYSELSLNQFLQNLANRKEAVSYYTNSFQNQRKYTLVFKKYLRMSNKIIIGKDNLEQQQYIEKQLNRLVCYKDHLQQLFPYVDYVIWPLKLLNIYLKCLVFFKENISSENQIEQKFLQIQQLIAKMLIEEHKETQKDQKSENQNLAKQEYSENQNEILQQMQNNIIIATLLQNIIKAVIQDDHTLLLLLILQLISVA